ncbi:MAG TPA: hypothetical protein VEZ11_13220 [Thermoanaerobaculia bacterium]|nr:hypothetical protein [Thermoanaerobaculia bacterium]
MNAAHLHLILTHFPPVLSLIAAGAAVVGFLRKRADLVSIALWLLVVIGAMVPVVYMAGDRAADQIGRVDGVQQDAIAPHERAGTISLVASAAIGALAAAALVWARRRANIPGGIRIILAAAALALAVVIGWTANLGGAIHHPEIEQH